MQAGVQTLSLRSFRRSLLAALRQDLVLVVRALSENLQWVSRLEPFCLCLRLGILRSESSCSLCVELCAESSSSRLLAGPVRRLDVCVCVCLGIPGASTFQISPCGQVASFCGCQEAACSIFGVWSFRCRAVQSSDFECFRRSVWSVSCLSSILLPKKSCCLTLCGQFLTARK